jgi:hypothetical protein
MSMRGLEFVRNWARTNVDVRLHYKSRDERAHVLAIACRRDASVALLGLQEIEDEVGNIETAFQQALSAYERLMADGKVDQYPIIWTPINGGRRR